MARAQFNWQTQWSRNETMIKTQETFEELMRDCSRGRQGDLAQEERTQGLNTQVRVRQLDIDEVEYLTVDGE